MYVLRHDHDQAITHFQSVLNRVDRFIPAGVQLARAFCEAGQLKATSNEVAAIKNFAPKYSLQHAQRMFPYPDPVELSRLIDALTEAGMTWFFTERPAKAALFFSIELA